jgi:2-dehydropantoate 2-reductase
MRIAVVGCGAVGSYYGAKLARARNEVHFLLRSDYEAVRRQGVTIRSAEGDFQVAPRCAKSPEEIGHSDLVLIGLKTTANHQLARLLAPLIVPPTVVLTLQNGLGNEHELARTVPSDQIMGGLCFVCLNRMAPGVIHHLGYGQVVLGEFEGQPQPRTHRIATMFEQAGIPCTVTENLARAHWEKLVWNIPFNGLGVASAGGDECLGQLLSNASTRPPLHISPTHECLTTDKLLADPKRQGLVRELMLEVIAAARGAGFDIPDSWAEEQIERTRTMGAYKASTLIDFERGQPLELQSLFLEPLSQARQAGVATPRLAALCAALEALDRTKHRGQAGPA